MSISIITVIAADRYFAIKHLLKAKVLRSPLKAVFISYCSIQVTAELLRKKNEDCHKEKVLSKVIYLVSANTAAFIICFLPFYLSHLLCFIMDSISSSCSAIQRFNNSDFNLMDYSPIRVNMPLRFPPQHVIFVPRVQ